MRLLLLLFLFAPHAAFAQAFSFSMAMAHAREGVTPNETSGSAFDEATVSASGVGFTLRSPVLGFPSWVGKMAKFERSGWEFYDLFEAEAMIGMQSKTARAGASSAKARGVYQAYTFRLGLQALQYQGSDYLHVRAGLQKMLSERHIFNEDEAVFDIENRWEPYVVVGRHRGRKGIEVGAGTGGYLMFEHRNRSKHGLSGWFMRAERHAQKLSGSKNSGLYLTVGVVGGL